jgi:hypothetical protein
MIFWRFLKTVLIVVIKLQSYCLNCLKGKLIIIKKEFLFVIILSYGKYSIMVVVPADPALLCHGVLGKIYAILAIGILGFVVWAVKTFVNLHKIHGLLGS